MSNNQGRDRFFYSPRVTELRAVSGT